MFCESWREALSDAALRGEQPPRDADLHLSSCGGCRSAFAEERQLFASISASLRIAANAEVPASLLPRVRVAVAQNPSQSAWRLPVWAFASAALLLVAAVAYEWTRSSQPAVSPRPRPTIGSETPNIAAASHPDPRPETAASPNSAPTPHVTFVHTAASRTEPEVLVSGDEQANLLLYLNRVRARNVNHTAPQVILTGDTTIKPLEIAQLDVPELTIKPLEDGDSR